MAPFAAQPSQEHPHQHGSIEPIGLGPSVLARDRDAAGMDDMSLNSVPGEPPCQPETVSSGFERNNDACDGKTFPDALVTPAMQHTKSPVSSGTIFFIGWRSIPGMVPAISQLD